MDIRDKKQGDIIETYFHSLYKHKTIVSATGTGKSFIALKIIERQKPDKVLILVNSTDLRDNNWKDEFIKFGMQDVYEESVTMQTYQYMYKQETDPFELTKKSLVIMDEVDFIADTDKLSQVIDLYQNHKILGLTGYIPNSKSDWFSAYLPVIYVYSAHEAQEEGLLNNIKFVFIKYDLSKDPNGVEVKYKKQGEMKSFFQSENAAYDYAHKKFATLIAQKEMAKKLFSDGEITDYELDSKLKSLDYKLRYAINERSNLLLNFESSSDTARKLIEYIQSTDKDHKIIVFSKRVKQSIKVCGKDNVYNGKTKGTKVFDKFKTGEISVLGVCDKINRGVNIDSLNYAIFETFYGSDTKATQRFGRLLRLHPGEFATIYILLPYFMFGKKDGTYENKPTQQVIWAAKMLSSTVIKHKQVWDYRITHKNK